MNIYIYTYIHIYIYIHAFIGFLEPALQVPKRAGRPRPWMVDLEIKMTKAQRESCKERSTEKEVVKVKKQGSKVSVLGPQGVVSESDAQNPNQSNENYTWLHVHIIDRYHQGGDQDAERFLIPKKHHLIS